jgi:Zn-dependent protease with chaperone function
MGEVIQIRDLQAARERAHRRERDYQSIERALALMRDNLAWAADQLRTAPFDTHPELLDRIEKLTATIRYGMLMLNEPGGGTATDGSDRRL